MGLFDEGIEYGERAQKIAEAFPSDQYLFFKSLGGLCAIHFMKGEPRRIFEGAKRLLEFGESNANSRSKVFGHWFNAFGNLAAGDMKSSQRNSEKAMEVALDPFYAQFPKCTLGLSYFSNGQLQEAENVLPSCINFCEKQGIGEFSAVCQYFLAPILITKGQMQQGMRLLEKMQKTLIGNQRRVCYAQTEYIRGDVNSQMSTGPKPSWSIMTKNIGFLVKNVPFASKKAEEHLKKAVELFKEIGVKSHLGVVYLSLSRLYRTSRRTDLSRQCIQDAISIFEECETEAYLKQANEALDSLG